MQVWVFVLTTVPQQPATLPLMAPLTSPAQARMPLKPMASMALISGSVTCNNTGGCAVLLNQSRNGSVGTVTGSYNNNGGGYATFRVANSNGPNVTCAKVYSRNSGRGFFSVTGSNGTTVSTVDIANSTSHGIFLEDASNTRVNAGTVSNGHPNVQHVRTSNCRTAVKWPGVYSRQWFMVIF